MIEKHQVVQLLALVQLLNLNSINKKNDKIYKNTVYDISNKKDKSQVTAIARNFIQKWTVENNVSRTALNFLLQFLHQIFPELPVDYRTILQTPRNSEVVPLLSFGQYLHIGIEPHLESLLDRCANIPHQLSIDVDIDGLPIYQNCTEKDFWLILGSVQEIDDSVFVIGVYRGKGKPQNFALFLRRFVDDMKNLLNNGYEYKGEHISVISGLYPMDSPAACGVTQFNGYYSCPKCLVPGRWKGRKVTFFGFHYESRTDKSFRERADPNFHILDSPLEELFIDMVDDILLDPLHVVYLDVAKRYLKIGFQEGRHFFLLDSRSQVTKKMLHLEKYRPPEIQREIRDIESFGHYKGTELRNFVLKYGVFVLKDSIPDKEYQNFLLLHVGISILCNFGVTGSVLKRIQTPNFGLRNFRTFPFGKCISEEANAKNFLLIFFLKSINYT
jgi:hypothetical protein